MTFYLKTAKILSLILIKYLYDVVLGKIFDTYFLRAPNHVEGVKTALDVMGWKYISSNIYLFYS